MSRTKSRLLVAPQDDAFSSLETVGDDLLDIAAAAREGRLDGSVAHLRSLQKLCMRLAREASDVAVVLSSSIDAAQREVEIAALKQKAAKS